MTPDPTESNSIVRRLFASADNNSDDGCLIVGGEAMGIASRLGELVPLLSRAEADRASRFRSKDGRTSFVAAHLLARVVVAELTGTAVDDVDIEQWCHACGSSEHGRPTVALARSAPTSDVSVSWSHSRTWVLVAASRAWIGVDIEDISTEVPRTPEVFCGAELAELQGSAEPGLDALRWWTRKEALAKVGLVEIDNFGNVDVRQGYAHADAPGGIRLQTETTGSWVASVAHRDVPDGHDTWQRHGKSAGNSEGGVWR